MESSSSTRTAQIMLVTLAVFLLFVTIVGLIWLAGAGTGVSLSLSFAAGLSMIFLPCTLPLVFVIVPLAMGENPRKGFIMALLFGLGLTITLTLYGVVISQLGAYLGLDNATRIMFIVAGFAALLFGWNELHLFKFELPSVSSAPQWVYNQKDYLKSFMLGFFLGNAGVGCPNPAFYVLLVYIATTGDMVTGASLGFVHGLGRATPLILFALLGILGVSAVSWTQKNAPKLRLWTAWALIYVGAFILTKGLLGMHWWEDSIFHSSWNNFIISIAPALAESGGHPVSMGFFTAPLWAGWASMLGLTFITIIWFHLRHTISGKAWTIILVIYVLFLSALFTGRLAVQEGHSHGEEQIEEHQEGDEHPVPFHEEHQEGDEHSPDEYS